MTEQPSASRRYLRLMIDLEVEITDPTAAHAQNMNWGRDEFGNEGMVEPMDWGGSLTQDEGAVVQAVQEAVAIAVHQGGADRGFKLLGLSVLPRLLDETGENYRELPLPAMPARRDDGKFPDEA